MDLVQLSERRIDELVAAFAVYGDRLTDVGGSLDVKLLLKMKAYARAN